MTGRNDPAYVWKGLINLLHMADFANADLILAGCFFLAAALYSSVGHAGATAYLALMALFGVPAPAMRPTALTLNMLVASIGSWRYWRAGYLRFRTLWPFLVGSVPMAFLGGFITLPNQFYRPLVGAVLVLSAVRLLWPQRPNPIAQRRDPPVPLAMAIGLAVGLLAGLTGTGGGVWR